MVGGADGASTGACPIAVVVKDTSNTSLSICPIVDVLDYMDGGSSCVISAYIVPS
jgi:hypothetical protein